MQEKVFPGKDYYDIDNVKIEAHGGSIYFEDGVYYWYGENKDHTTKKGKIWTWGVRIYSSKDLINWKDLGYLVYPKPDDKKSLFYPNRKLDRPHLLKNDKTNKYVLWLKYSDDGSYAILQSDKLLGPYELVKEAYHPFGYKCGDFDLEKDEETKEAFIYFETNHDSLCIAKLDDSYLNCIEPCKKLYSDLYPPFAREGVAHFKRNGKHYLLTSGMTGYVPNPCTVAMSEDRYGPYTDLGSPFINDDSYASFNSQPSQVFYIKDKDSYLLLADRWVPSCVMNKERYELMIRVIASRKDKKYKPSLKDFLAFMKLPLLGSADTSKATYVWLPIAFDNDKPQIAWKDEFKPLD